MLKEKGQTHHVDRLQNELNVANVAAELSSLHDVYMPDLDKTSGQDLLGQRIHAAEGRSEKQVLHRMHR